MTSSHIFRWETFCGFVFDFYLFIYLIIILPLDSTCMVLIFFVCLLLVFLLFGLVWFWVFFGGVLFLNLFFKLLQLVIECPDISACASLMCLYSCAFWEWSVSSVLSCNLLIITLQYLFYCVHWYFLDKFCVHCCFFSETADLLIRGVITFFLWLPLMFASLYYLIKSCKMNSFDHSSSCAIL